MCHLILLMPLLGLSVFWLMPPSYSIPVYSALLLFSALTYWLGMRAMRRPVAVGMESMVGMTVEVVKSLDPQRAGMYLVRLEGELWTARCRPGLEPGDRAAVVSFQGNSLMVEPLGHDRVVD